MTDKEPYIRKIRSFVMRTGRMTEGQQKMLDEQWLVYGLESEQKFNAEIVFGRQATLVVEIGFGMGDSLLQMAQNHPDTDFVGIEVHTPGVGRILRQANQLDLKNLRVYRHDAVEILANCFEDNIIDRMQLYFPDPWHKKKHHKRRIVQPEFAEIVRRKLKAGGIWHMATDWQAYAEHMVEIMAEAPGYCNNAGDQLYVSKPDYRPETKFERRGEKLGHGVWDMVFEKKK